ncbi:YitT family protein [Liquorilactobacillus capillatus]|uniref:DUF2179 domain-containing protein n=1 Tax=Liquorilactobacillus capillatus DSM 19910 TaxID=1423731 RepID=A0A0R1M311_9LACO|nr:YitT family protein [Liquorilactobacillus capillatus]KRL02412.1 hypothetical protein FC81_GL000756 [Liquorilactobacillus capillatus DSM 19910]
MKKLVIYFQQLNLRISEFLGIAAGTFIYSMTYNYLLLPCHLGEGGAMGITAILYYTFNFPSYISNFLINLFLIIIGYRLLNTKTTLLTIWGLLCMTIFLKLPVIYNYHTNQLIIPTLLAGALTGISMGIIFKSNGTIAGDSIIGKIINRYWGISLGTGSLIFNLFVAIPFIFIIGFNNTILTIIYLYTCSVFTNQFLSTIGAKKAIMIISPRYRQIAANISSQFKQEITILTATGYYSDKDQPMLYMIASPKRVMRLVPIIEEEDKNAFIVVEDIRSARGLDVRSII